MSVKIQQESFSISKMISQLSEKDHVGAVVTFSGYVREFSNDNQLQFMELEYYPGMTERALENIEKKARNSWDIDDIKIIHRVGKLSPKDLIVGVVVSSKHRSNAFKACEFIIDFLKTDAPFWKKEVNENGASWVNERQEDITKKSNWNKIA